MVAKKKRKTTKKKAVVGKKVRSPAMCVPEKGDWAHTLLAAIIVVFAFVSASWATWVIVLAAGIIFLSGVMKVCKK